MKNIRDVDNIKGEHESLFENVKERYDVARKQVNSAVKLYEESDPSGALTPEDIYRDQFKQEIIEKTLKGDFASADDLLKSV